MSEVITTNENSVQVLQPYWYQGTWVFDDASKNLNKEAFVAGADDIISYLVDHHQIEDPDNGFRLIFAGTEFPDYQLAADWVEEGSGGNWYVVRGLGFKGWLCPALFKYFDKAPKQLYIKVESLKKRN